jgi:hypothetical protein
VGVSVIVGVKVGRRVPVMVGVWVTVGVGLTVEVLREVGMIGVAGAMIGFIIPG